MPLAGLAHGGDGTGLIVLDAHHTLSPREQAQDDFDAFHDFRGLGAHELVVTGDVWLALGTVGNDIADFLRFLYGEFDVGGETGAAHAHNAGGLHAVENLLVCQILIVAFGSHALGHGVFPVGGNDNGLCHAAHDGGAHLHRLDRAGNRADNIGGHKSAGFGNQLTGQNMVAFRNHRCGRFSDVLVGHNHQVALGGVGNQGHFTGKLLHLPGMNTASEC